MVEWGAERKKTTAVINLTSIFEKADESILPAMYKYISKDFDATPAQMGALSLCRGLTQALTTSVGGISGERTLSNVLALFGMAHITQD